MRTIYLIGSLRNPEVPVLAKTLREAGHSVFDDWYAAGPEADDYWRKYEIQKGNTYKQALAGYAANHVWSYDHHHLDRCDTALLQLPAGKSGHLELGYAIGKGKRGIILLDDPEKSAKLPEQWRWLTGVYEGEGTLTRNGKKGGHGMQLTVTMKDEDVIRRLHATAGVGSVEGPYKRVNKRSDYPWADMWRWSVRKREDVLYVLSGMWDDLCKRRREQADRVLTAAGMSIKDIFVANSPKEYRFDVMYRFATVCENLNEVLEALA